MYYTYILANRSNKILYIGMTNDLIRRTFEHKEHKIEGFTKIYKIDKLVYYEVSDDVKVAIEREKELKGWIRKKKIDLIQSVNPKWEDLSSSLQ